MNNSVTRRPSPLKVTLLKTGQTFDDLSPQRGCFEDWFSAIFGELVGEWEVVRAHQGEPLPPASAVEAVVVSGSPASVYEREAWSEASAAWLAEVIARDVPVLGVCYGHQLIAHALGGEVRRSPQGREMGAVEIERLDMREGEGEGDPIFEGLPPRFSVWQSHMDEVSVAPPGAKVLARNEHTAVQAMAGGERCRTIQWHPEFDAEIARHYIRARAHLIDAERGEGAAAALELTQPAALTSGATITRNFALRWLGASEGLE